MNAKQIILAGCAVMALSIGAAQAGPCDMTSKSASTHDAGSGPTPGNTGQTTGTAAGTSANQHAATSTMNRASARLNDRPAIRIAAPSSGGAGDCRAAHEKKPYGRYTVRLFSRLPLYGSAALVLNHSG